MTDPEKWKILYDSSSDITELLKCIEKLKLLEIEALKLYKQSPEHHPEGITVYDHVIACLKTLNSTEPLINLAILFHDVGKPIVAEKSKNGDYYHFYNHDKEGEIYCDQLAKIYNWSPHDHEIIKFCCGQHMRYHRINEMRLNKVYILSQNPYFRYLKIVAWADEKCRGFSTFDEKWQERLNIIEKAKELYAKH